MPPAALDRLPEGGRGVVGGALLFQGLSNAFGDHCYGDPDPGGWNDGDVW
ncbi:hypothetical protein [Amycolatopsis tolypomycina]|nr:hypothetical protein [Amycolatopsis tolypomycina]